MHPVPPRKSWCYCLEAILIRVGVPAVDVHGEGALGLGVSVEWDEGEAYLVELVADVDQQVLYLLVHIASDSCLLAVLVEGRFYYFWLLFSRQLIISLELADDCISIDVDGKALTLISLRVIDLHINCIFSFAYFKEAIEALMIAFDVFSIVKLILAYLGVTLLLCLLLRHEVFDRRVPLVSIHLDSRGQRQINVKVKEAFHCHFQLEDKVWLIFLDREVVWIFNDISRAVFGGVFRRDVKLAENITDFCVGG